jgi:regulator of sirC expression with transglutaminase-like and TPR domain
LGEIKRPVYCRPEAYALFAEQMRHVDSGAGLLRAAVAIAAHEMPEVKPGRVEAQIQRLADEVGARVRSRHPEAVLAHAHDVLFEEHGYRGNATDYYNPLNSYLPAVLELKRGLPITLTLIYKSVMERLGVRVLGINAPWHFLAGVDLGGVAAGGPGGAPANLMLVDAFSGGEAVSRDEAFRFIERTARDQAPGTPGATVPLSDDLLRPATHRQWLRRMLQNLQFIFSRESRNEDLAAMLELTSLLETPA